jgi:hypothetical protein
VKTPIKNKKIKARKMWKVDYCNSLRSSRHKAQTVGGFLTNDKTTTQYVLPADAASIERMVEQMAEAIAPSVYDACAIDAARAALAAIGITKGRK